MIPTPTSPRRAWLALLLAILPVTGCAATPPATAPEALYLDLRKMVELSEDSGWTVDATRLEANREAALRSVCQADAPTRAALEQWLVAQIAASGGSARARFERTGRQLSAITETLSLERTQALLRLATSHAAVDCPFWLAPRAEFRGEQSDLGHWLLLGETQAFGTIAVPGPVPALGGGGRLLLGRGLTQRFTLAAGVDAAASGTFIPSSGSQGIDAYLTLAAPVSLRVTRFSRLLDLELAPVVRFSHGRSSWPPGGRVEVGYGYSSIRSSSWLSYFTIYAGYELHGLVGASDLDHTFQLGTKLSLGYAL